VVVDLDGEGKNLYLYGAPQRGPVFTAGRPAAFAANEWLHVCSIALSAEPSRSTTFAAMEESN
jgi:fructokinase